MSKLVIINLGNGDLDNGFPHITTRIINADSGENIRQFTGSLPPKPELAELSEKYALIYNNLTRQYAFQILDLDDDDDDGITIVEAGVTNITDTALSDLNQQLETTLNKWLSSQEFIEKQLRTHLDPQEVILIIIEVPDTPEILQKLPWQCWNLLKDYPKSEIVLRRQEIGEERIINQDKIKILVIVGDDTLINVEEERKFFNEIQCTEVKFLVRVSRQEVFNQLWEGEYDILLFNGHSTTKNGTGIMYLLDETGQEYSLTIEELTNALTKAVNNQNRPLKLAIFNSCKGQGLAFQIAKLNIPLVIFMREPIANKVAQQFFRYFMQAFAQQQQPLLLAYREARQKLQGLEKDFPGASLLPVIYCTHSKLPMVQWREWMPLSWFWEQLQQKASKTIDWLQFYPFTEDRMGWNLEVRGWNVGEEIELPPLPDIILEKDISYSIKIDLNFPGSYLILLNQGLPKEGKATKYLMCPSRVAAPNNRLSEQSMFIPQRQSSLEKNGIDFDSPGQEEFIAIVLDRPLILPWMKTTENQPVAEWDAAEIKQLFNSLEGYYWQAFYRRCQVR